MTPAEIARGLTKAQREAVLGSIDFGSYRMVGCDNPEAKALHALGATVHGIVMQAVYAAILEQEARDGQ